MAVGTPHTRQDGAPLVETRRPGCAPRKQPQMPKDSPYVTKPALASIKQGCSGTDNLAITDEMLLWTPAEARRYFESLGSEKPDTTGRSSDDKEAPLNKIGPKRARQDLTIGCCCPCCDMIIVDALEKRAEKKKRANMDVDGSPVGLEMQR